MTEAAELIARLRERARNLVPEDNPLGMTPGDFLEGQAADHIEALEAERGACLEELGRVIMACPSGYRDGPKASDGVKKLRAAFEALMTTK